MDLVQLLSRTDGELSEWLGGSSMTRPGLNGLRRNAALVLGNSGDPRAVPILQTWADSADPVVSDAARWALERITEIAANTTNADAQKNQ